MTQELTVTQKIDKLQVAMMRMPQVECPLVHTFTPGLYGRQIFNPKGALIITKIHKTEHQFIISQGELSVWTAEEGVVRHKAPYHGITKPGTRRIIYAHEDTILTTFHATDETTPEAVEAAIIEPHVIDEKLLDGQWSLGDIFKQLTEGGTS